MVACTLAIAAPLPAQTAPFDLVRLVTIIQGSGGGRGGRTNTTTSVVTGTRTATIEELSRLAAVGAIDSDLDGVPNTMDVSPTNPFCGSADGSYLDLRDSDGDGRVDCLDADPLDPSVWVSLNPLKEAQHNYDAASRILLHYDSVQQLGDEILRQNAVAQLYDPLELLQVFSVGGVSPEIIDHWRRQFVCGNDLKKRCRQRCLAQFLPNQCTPECEPGCRKHPQTAQLQACLAECNHDIPQCPPEKRPATPPAKGGRP